MAWLEHRAITAERSYQDMLSKRNAERERAEAAERKLAELVREVREWWHEANVDSPEPMLAKYEPKAAP